MKRWLLLFMLLASTTMADSWLDSRADYYIAARMKLGYTTASSGLLSDATGSLLFNEAATLILPINRGLKRLTTITTSYHENTYALDTTMVDIETVWIDSSGTVKVLKYLPIGLWGEQEHDDADDTRDFDLTRPSYYDYTDSVILVHPAPGQTRVDTLTVMGWHRLPDVETATVPTVIPEMYRLSILYHMVWNQAKARHDPRTEVFKNELVMALGQIGLKLTRGGQVVADN